MTHWSDLDLGPAHLSNYEKVINLTVQLSYYYYLQCSLSDVAVQCQVNSAARSRKTKSRAYHLTESDESDSHTVRV